MLPLLVVQMKEIGGATYGVYYQLFRRELEETLYQLPKQNLASLPDRTKMIFLVKYGAATTDTLTRLTGHPKSTVKTAIQKLQRKNRSDLSFSAIRIAEKCVKEKTFRVAKVYRC